MFFFILSGIIFEFTKLELSMALTKYKEGSLQELCAISFPLMLSSLSVMAMLFVDRLFLAKFSLEAFNAAIAAGTLGWAFILGALVLTSISQVFVAQYYGAGRTEKLGEPVWQMIWLSLGMSIAFFPLALFGSDWFFGSSPETKLQMEYFKWLMFFGSSYAMYGALCGFFVGQGKVRLITLIAFLANFVNAGLDWVMIFGIPDLFPSLGVRGAAIATCTSQMFQVVVLFYLFLKKENRETYQTSNYKIHWDAMYQCIRIGSPAAIFMTLEILGWAIYYQLMVDISEKHITVAGIWQSLIILFWFITEGVQKGISTLAGNFIGAGKRHLIRSSFFAGIKILLLLFTSILVLIMGFQEKIVEYFLTTAEISTIDEYRDAIFFCTVTGVLYMLFEGIRYLIAGILTAAGDTMFLLATGCISIWIFLIAPVYYIVVKNGSSIEVSSLICTAYAGLAAFINFVRYKQGKWKTIVITA